MNDLSFHDFQIPFLIRSNFSLSRPVIRGLGREISLRTCFSPLYFSLNVASLTLLSLLCLVLKTFSSMFTGANGVLAGETLIYCLYTEQHSAHSNCSFKENPAQPQPWANLLAWEPWGNGWNYLSSLSAKAAKNWIYLYWLFFNWCFSFPYCLRTYTCPNSG